MNMKVLTIDGPGKVSYRTEELPELKNGEVLVKVAYVGLCGTDVSFYEGGSSFERLGRLRYPIRIGHEFSGVVAQVGPNTTLFKAGDRVTGDSGVSCGVCEMCVTGRFRQCHFGRATGTIGNTWPGAFAEYVMFPERHLNKIPDHMTLESAALVEPTSIVYAGLLKRPVYEWETIILVGTGPIGLAGVPIAKAMGAERVIMVGRRDEKLAVATKLGATHVVNMSKVNAAQAVAEITDGHMGDLVIDCSGSPACVDLCVDLVAAFGTISLLSFYEVENIIFDIDKFVPKQASMVGVMGMSDGVGRTLEVLGAHNIDLSPLITHRFNFDEAKHAIETAKAEGSQRIKAMIHVNQDIM